ncbi:PREDICTED: uncharacterized protein C7orf50 homolog [Eufriesea mexicana]|nr:PREDICTED: uncharacterized protein C7orf50 homolog [Eufriesea mexicana]
MGFDNMSKFEVKNPESRKRTKKKCKSKGITNKANNNVDIPEYDTNQVNEVNELNMKKQKEKKKMSNTINDIHKKIIMDNEEENNKEKNNWDEEESNDEATPPKKKANIHAGNSLNDIEEIHKSDIKGPKQPSKRQMKREKAEKKVNEKRMANKMEAIKKGLNYVSKWKHARTEWKFEKLRQIWLIDNLLDETSIPDDIFPTVLEYFEGCKGMAREQLLKKGMDVIRKVEENEENKNEVESIAYQRARRLLQALPTET